MENSNIEKLLNYYKGSEVRITDDYHPHFNAIGEVVGAGETTTGPGLKIKRFDTQETFFVFDVNHLKIIKRK
ncbi:hypothetical protein [Pedobacter sp. ASV28]|jgi:hypothetical protein|uniref:hypothetical protein n=1 Tax=Pedobacter sp. ASV28 TaxID=2795123 RepID=UPI0018ECCEBA|nr:hypothetical protein [Pedobacter sp. ASV28]